MLYILPPPKAPKPPSPWGNILSSNSGNKHINNNGTAHKKPSWEGSKRPARVRFKQPRQHEDESYSSQDENMDSNRNHKSLSECYFAGKGTALVLPAAEAQKSTRRTGDQGSNIQKHLQSMFYLLRPEETLKMAVKLESVHPTRTRYLVVVSRMGQRGEESSLLGIDCNDNTTVGLVLRVMADTTIRLDGDGGFSVSVCGRHHIFKPVSVQAMWSALQTLHKVSSKAREQNYFQGGLTHSWVNYYEERIESDRSCLNEWHAMDNLESKRPPSPDSIRTKPTEREETEKVIRSTLKEIMMSVDLDEVTSKYIRTRLEEDLDMDLGEYKSFIDQEMLTILGQMDAPTEIFDHVYLGSEWNASNYEELQRNGVGHILNVTREIDNFFPGTFDYLNVRVYDDEKTDLLKHWDDTFKYITKAKKNGSKVLVHCKMGVSRSASVVIAYAMKAYNWDFQTALVHVKEKRTCIKPNTSFLSQLETYQGILDAMKNKEKLQRSKSETNLKLPASSSSGKGDKVLVGSEPTPMVQALSIHHNNLQFLSGQDLRHLGARPKSWSPDNLIERDLMDIEKSPVFLSLEDLSQKSTSKERLPTQARNVLMPCDNGESYSVSPNQIFHLPGQHHEIPSVKERVSELEYKKADGKEETPPLLRAVLPKKEIWDPGDAASSMSPSSTSIDSCDLRSDDSNSVVVVSETVWTSSTVVKNVPEIASSEKVPESPPQPANKPTQQRKDGDPFSNQLDRVFDREEKKQKRMSTIPILTMDSSEARDCPSRQSSWSSYDSAVVLNCHNDNGLSRHSSWGSGDTRTVPSRNSSWGSYDMRPRGAVHYVNEKGEKVQHPSNSELFESNSSGIFPYDREDIPWHPGTVKRTKQKIEERKISDMTKSSSSETLYEAEQDPPVEAVNKHLITNSISSAISSTPTIKIPGDKPPVNISRLSVSAPESSAIVILTPQECSLSRSTSNLGEQPACGPSLKISLETLRQDKPADWNADNGTSSGLVQNLKKEFEAKTSTNESNHETSKEEKKGRVSSLPSSPVSLHHDKEKNHVRSEELNFKNLVGLFENNKQPTHMTSRKKILKPFLPKTARYSCIEVSVEKSPIRITQTPVISSLSKNDTSGGEFKRPPISPVVRNAPSSLVATVIAAAKKQQQFGKSHPLARLTVKSKHNNPLYNTM